MVYDELTREIYRVIRKIQSDPESEEQLRRLKLDIHKNGVKVAGDPYLMNEETDARIEINQVVAEFKQIADQVKEPDIRQYLLEMKAELGVNDTIDE